MPKPSAIDSKLADTEFGSIEYVDRGTGAPVLVVHGSPGGCDQGSLLGNFLVAAGFRVIAPSRPGYMRTALTPENASIDAQADAHAALMTELGIERFAVVCWSGGGPSTYRLAVRHPNRVSTVVAIAALSGPHVWNESIDEKLVMHTRPGYWLLSAMARWAPKQTVAGTLGAEGALSKHDLKALAASVYSDEVKRAFVIAISLMASHTPPRKEGIGNDKRNYAAMPDLELSHIQAPALLIHGDVDTDVDIRNSEHAGAQLANSTMVSMPGGGHICFWTAPESADAQTKVIEFLGNNA